MKKPNIVFIFTDQQHWHAAGYMDPFYDTPAMDTLAAEGTAFTRAYCSTPQCSPSRSSLMTGYYPHKTKTMGNIGAAGGGNMTMDTVGKKLRAAGYRTGYFGKWHIGEDANGTAGWDEQYGIAGNHHNDRMHPRMALDFIRRNAGKKGPFALYVSINNPHDIYHFGIGERSESDKQAVLPDSYRLQDFTTVPGIHRQFMTDDQGSIMSGKEEKDWREYRKLYRDKVKMADDILGAVIDKLKAAGEYDNSLIIFTSDHGDMDSHNRLIFKGPFMYDHMLRVPLIIKTPGSTVNMKTDAMSINTDLVPTIMDYAGLEKKGYDGVSLRPLLDDGSDSSGHDHIIAQYYSKQKWINPIRTVITEKYKYNRYITHGEELYDLTADPGEVKNLAGDPALGEIKQELRTRLDAWMKENDDPFETFTVTDREGNNIV